MSASLAEVNVPNLVKALRERSTLNVVSSVEFCCLIKAKRKHICTNYVCNRLQESLERFVCFMYGKRS
jgi:hypothetical protein